MRRASLVIAVLTALVLTGAVAASAQAPAPGLGIRLTEAPASRSDDPRARSYVIDHVAPGASFSREVEVTNGTAEPVSVDLYVAPATVRGGSFEFAPRGAPGELARWASFAQERIALGPNASARVSLRVAVPTDAPSGEYYGVAWAELPGTAPSSGGVGVARRVGVRIYLSVGPGGEPRSDFELSTLTARRDANGAPFVEASVRNTGGRALDMTGDLRLTDGPGGLSAGPFTAEVGTTLGVGQRAPVRVNLDRRLPDGPWTARLALRSGTIERAAEGVITFPDQAGGSAAPVPLKQVTGTPQGRLALAVALGALAVIGLAATGVAVQRRRALTAAANALR